jgi:ribonuclease HIII
MDVGKIIGDRLLSTLEAAEEKVDEEIARMDRMEEDELEVLRRKRLDQMKKVQKQKAEWKAAGHGVYAELTDEKTFFSELKKSKRAIVHFYRPTTRRCEIVDKHMVILAAKHPEARFIKVNAEKSPFLVERLRIVMLPTITLVREGRTDHAIIGFDEMGGGDDFTTASLEAVLVAHGLLFESYSG